MLRRLRFSVGGTFGFQLAALAVSTAGAVVTARALGPEGQGLVSVAMLAPSILVLVLNGGLSVANVYYAAQEPRSVPQLITNTAVYIALASIAAALVTAGLAATGVLEDVLPGVSTRLIVLAVALLPFLLAQDLFGGILRGRQWIVYVSAADLVQATAGLIALVALLDITSNGPAGAVGAYLVAAVAAASMIQLGLRRACAAPHRGVDRPMFGRMLRFGGHNYLANVVQFFIFRLDVMILNIVTGALAVGLYSVAFKIGEALWLFPHAVGLVMLSRAAALSDDDLNRSTPRVFGATLAVSTLAALGVATLGPVVIRVLFSSAFSDAYTPLLWLLPGITLMGCGSVLGNEIAGRGRPAYNAAAAAVALAVAIVADVTLIPAFEANGAAAASSIAYAVNCALNIVFYLRVSATPARAFARMMTWRDG